MGVDLGIGVAMDDKKIIFSAKAICGLQRRVQRAWHCSSSRLCNQALPYPRYLLFFYCIDFDFDF